MVSLFTMMVVIVVLITIGYSLDMYEHWKERRYTDKWIHIFGIIGMWIVMWIIWNNLR